MISTKYKSCPSLNLNFMAVLAAALTTTRGELTIFGCAP